MVTKYKFVFLGDYKMNKSRLIFAATALAMCTSLFSTASRADERFYQNYERNHRDSRDYREYRDHNWNYRYARPYVYETPVVPYYNPYVAPPPYIPYAPTYIPAPVYNYPPPVVYGNPGVGFSFIIR